MNAKEANEKAKIVKSLNYEAEYKSIKIKISHAVEKGLFKIYDNWITPETKEKLEEEGYVINQSSRIGIYDSATTTISW